MSTPALPGDGNDAEALLALNYWLGRQDVETRVRWMLENVPGAHALSSSFGAQAAVSLHLLGSQEPGIPVILIDTGYLFPETYQFVDTLTERLSLNLKVYRPVIGRAWAEARYGKQWEQGIEGLNRYNRIRKIEPMQRALAELGVRGWFAGLRRDQSRSRRAIDFVEWRQGRWKLHPIADWTDRDVGRYLQKHALPYHPLWEQGYISIGDTHTTHRWEPGMDAEDTRFFGLKRECGLHEAP
ncbi:MULTISPECIES: phosphoadenylyl-sulfate reductase [Rhodanobacter]|uniref:Phosphoadenosine 5'-phosphosulfate reductase n=1 Tax=Rhodanobacter hydrolyticus TaxID=2250595 RepID=A0ABW8J2L1_9GAMM|nr:phosphoadenylyl-sulfate reductase [Rhodanobacter sp. 7MK24]MBD8879700.1 phosphoadenylyl-sulfate reductase [Rhodanobacter sp. 7MK24]